jgi:hypothetical protein
MPENLPLLQQIGEDFLSQLVERQPNAILQQHCQAVQRQRGITINLQILCNPLLRIGMPSPVCHQLPTAISDTPAA